MQINEPEQFLATNVTQIANHEEHQLALSKLLLLMERPEECDTANKEIDALVNQIEAYEKIHFPISSI